LILHVDTGREWRGGQTQLLHLVRAAGGEVALPPDALLRPALEAAGVPVHPIAFGGVWRGTLPLARLLRARPPELVAAHTSHAHGHAILAGRVPVVVHRRVDFVPGADPVTRWKYGSPAGFVAVSRAVARLLERFVPADRIAVVPDGVDRVDLPDRVAARRELDLPDGPIVGAVGALVPHKGHIHLVRAMAGLDALLVIAGEGPERPRLEGPRVRLPGRVHAPTLLAAIDVLVHPSVGEGMGQVVVEAMLAGVPVVCTSAGGLPEVVEAGRTGLVVPPGDDRALAAAIRQVLADPEGARIRAEAGREAARRFSVAAMVEGTLAAYARFTGAARTRVR
jgi:glycosyltransferase involved in cell wall biosynthesis